VQNWLDEHPEKMRQRQETVEHPFGTIKARMGAAHFLLKLRKLIKNKLIDVRYKDIVSSLKHLEPVFEFCDSTYRDVDDDLLHQQSLQKWKHDSRFKFTLSNEAVELAEQFGYERDELMNDNGNFRSLALAWKSKRGPRLVTESLKALSRMARERRH
jgi:hypothetical protein